MFIFHQCWSLTQTEHLTLCKKTKKRKKEDLNASFPLSLVDSRISSEAFQRSSTSLNHGCSLRESCHAFLLSPPHVTTWKKENKVGEDPSAHVFITSHWTEFQIKRQFQFGIISWGLLRHISLQCLFEETCFVRRCYSDHITSGALKVAFTRRRWGVETLHPSAACRSVSVIHGGHFVSKSHHKSDGGEKSPDGVTCQDFPRQRKFKSRHANSIFISSMHHLLLPHCSLIIQRWKTKGILVFFPPIPSNLIAIDTSPRTITSYHAG